MNPPKQKKELSKILEHYIPKQGKNETTYKEGYRKFIRSTVKTYNYAEVFNISVCPYCNINYIFVLRGKGKKKHIGRPQFDHFEPQGRDGNYENILDPHNLVPCCPICNLTKSDKAADLHPFEEDFDSIAEFTVKVLSPNILEEEYISHISQSCINSAPVEIDFTKREQANDAEYGKAKNNIERFKLKDRYQKHTRDVVNIFRLISHYNTCRQEEIFNLVGVKSNLYSSLNLLLAGMINDDINNTSLGKLKKDIFEKYAY